MVTRWGLTEKLGPLAYSEDEDEVFLGRSVTQHKHMSDDTARLIDEEVRDIIDAAHGKARDLLESNLQQLHLMAGALMKYETLDRNQLDQVMEGREPDPPEDWGDSDSDVASSGDRTNDGEDRTSVGGPAEQV